MTLETIPRRPEVNPWVVAFAVMFATFMEVLDTTVVNVSLPHIAGSLSATVNESTWTLTTYLVANAIVLPIAGWLASYFGRKRILMLSVTGFCLASLLCGLAWTLPVLILFRALQGAAGGALQPLSQAVLLEAFRPEDRGKAMAFWGLGIVVAPIIGPVLGGWLTDSYSWRLVFYINLPVGIISLIMMQLFLFDPAYIRRTSSRIDYWGIGMLTVGIGALQVMLDRGQEKDWFGAQSITTLAVIAAVGLTALIIHELRAKHPVVDLRVFKVRTYATGVFLMTTLGFVLYGSLVMLPILLQTLMGYPALDTGWTMMPRGIGSFLAMPIIGMIMMKFDARKILGLGFLITAVTMFQYSSLDLQMGYWDLFWPQFIQGIAMGMLFVPLTTITMDPIPNQAMGNATSIFNLLRNIGGSIGIATSTTLVARRQQYFINRLGAHVTPYSFQTNAALKGLRALLMRRGSNYFTATRQAYAALFGMVKRQATMLAFIQTFRVLGVACLVVLPFILLMRHATTRDTAKPGS